MPSQFPRKMKSLFYLLPERCYYTPVETLVSLESLWLCQRRGNFSLRTLAELTVYFFTKLVSTTPRNRRLPTKPVAGIVILCTLVKPIEDCMTERRSTSKLSLKVVTPPLLLNIQPLPIYFYILSHFVTVTSENEYIMRNVFVMFVTAACFLFLFLSVFERLKIF